MIAVGDRIPTWFSGQEDGMSTVTGVYPYIGAYPQFFTHILTLTAPNTRSGELSMTYNDPEARADMRRTET